MSTELFLNFLGIRMDSRKAEGMRFTINLITPDNGEKFLIEMENATLTNIQGFLSDKPDLTLTINRSDLEQTMMGAKTLEAQIADGTAKVEGDVGVLKQLASTMVDFDPRFEIMPGTKARETQARKGGRSLPSRRAPGYRGIADGRRRWATADGRGRPMEVTAGLAATRATLARFTRRSSPTAVRKRRPARR